MRQPAAVLDPRTTGGLHDYEAALESTMTQDTARSNTRRGGHAVVSVADNGPGIDLKQTPCLFKKFKRVEIVERQEGLGLGLYIVKELAEAHGGRVEVSSEPGVGSTFSVYLPLSADTQGG